MKAVRRLRGNVGKLGLKAAGALWPPNAIVLGRNSLDQARTDPWSDFIARSGRPAATVRGALEQGLRWLALAQDRSGAGGVASYEFYGWTAGYPEVTGYIIPTMWECRHALGRPDLGERATRMSDWELAIQRDNGGWEGGVEGENQPPIVFNTGQVIRGLLATHAETGEQRYLDAAVRAADWIADVQEDDGSWTRANYGGLKRVYDSYVSAPLARAAKVTGNAAYAEAAIRNCEFVLRQQRESGWFDLCDNSPFFVEAPVTHAIGYTIDGLLETGDLVGRTDFVAAATRAAEGVMGAISASGRLPGRLDERWEPRVRWVCLTGSAQIGIVLLKLHETTGEARYLDAARTLADFLVYVQRLNAVGTARSGALPGSYPVWGTYAPLKFPCWATKYLVDLLVMLERLDRDKLTVGGLMAEPRLLFVCSEMIVGGAERQWSLLIPRLRPRFDVSLLTLVGEGPFFGQLREAGVTVDCAHMRRRTDLRGWRRALRHAGDEPDLIVTQSINADIVGSVIAARAHAAQVSTAHFNVGPGAPRSRYRDLLARLLAPRVDGVIAVSEAQLPRLRQLGYRSDTIRLVANGVELPAARPAHEVREVLGIGPGEFLALLVATLRPEKRADLFVSAVRRAHAADPRVRGVVAGGGAELERARAAAGSDGVVQILGPRADVPDLMGAADAVCLASDAEGVPLVLLEAMALGRATVATGVGGVAEAVVDEKTGLLVPANDEAAFAAALLRLAADPELRLRLGEEGRRRHRERFGVDRMVEEYAQVFAAVLEKKGSAAT